MLTSALHETASVSQGISIEAGLVGFAMFMMVLLLVIRMKRSHDQKIRRAASSGFYDFDVARFGTASSTLMENAVTRAQFLAKIPMARAADAVEIANVIAFLASDEASYVTGAAWYADGGLTAI